MKKSFIAAALFLLAAFPAAAQNVVTLPQLPAATAPLDGTELVPIYQGTGTKRAKVADILVAYKAATAPNSPYFGQWWWDTSSTPADVLRVYDGAQWVASATMNTSAHTFLVVCGQLPALTGNVTTTGGGCAATIANNAVGNTKLAQMAATTIKGNATGSTANPADNTLSAYLDAAIGSSQGTMLCRGSSGWTAITAATGPQQELVTTASGTCPAFQNIGKQYFSVYCGTSCGSVSSLAKVPFDTVDTDPGSYWDATNHWFKPTVAGRYRFTCQVSMGSTGTLSAGSRGSGTSIIKNGSTAVANNPDIASSTTSTTINSRSTLLSRIVSMNGTTDTMECDGGSQASGPSFANGLANTYFEGSYVGP